MVKMVKLWQSVILSLLLSPIVLRAQTVELEGRTNKTQELFFVQFGELQKESTYADKHICQRSADEATASVLQLEQQIAAKPEGEGTKSAPYLIASLSNLRWLSENTGVWSSNAYFKQIADIDATLSATWNNGKGFTPIGSYNKPFSASYDGNNKIIHNLYIGANEQYIGFFGYVNNLASEVIFSHIRLEKLKIKAGENAKSIGGLIAVLDASKSIISDCHLSIDSIVVESAAQYVGGMLGYVHATSSFTITSSAVTGVGTQSALVAKSGIVGGFVGYIGDNGIMDKLYTDLTVIEAEAGNIDTLGGFVGWLNGGTSLVL